MKVLDHGYVKLIEAWGTGEAGVKTILNTETGGDAKVSTDYEVGIIEAARQSTQGAFRGWAKKPCDCDWRESGLQEGSHNKECAIFSHPGDKRLLSYLYKNHHSTPFEFAGMTVEVAAPIFVIREWQRHRTFSYNEASARYAPLPDINYIPTPERVMMQSKENKQAGALSGTCPLDEEGVAFFLRELEAVYRTAEDRYQAALQCGVPKELARCFLPVGRYSRMRVSGNLRNWLQFLTLRCDLSAQWEIRQYANEVAEIISTQFPYTYRLWEEMFGEGK